MEPAPEPPPPAKARTFWQRRLRDPIVNQLTQGVTPEKMALTLAIGSSFALFPILGTSTLLCFLAAILLRLNQPIIQAVNYICAPFHLPLIYVQLLLGAALFQVEPITFDVVAMNDLFWNDLTEFLHRFGAAALHAIVVWLLLAPLWSAAVYFAIRPILRGIVRVRAENAAKTLAAEPPVHPIP